MTLTWILNQLQWLEQVSLHWLSQLAHLLSQLSMNQMKWNDLSLSSLLAEDVLKELIKSNWNKENRTDSVFAVKILNIWSENAHIFLQSVHVLLTSSWSLQLISLLSMFTLQSLVMKINLKMHQRLKEMSSFCWEMLTEA